MKKTTKPLQQLKKDKIQIDASSIELFVLLLSYLNMIEYTHAKTGCLKLLFLCILFDNDKEKERNKTISCQIK